MVLEQVLYLFLDPGRDAALKVCLHTRIKWQYAVTNDVVVGLMKYKEGGGLLGEVGTNIIHDPAPLLLV